MAGFLVFSVAEDEPTARLPMLVYGSALALDKDLSSKPCAAKDSGSFKVMAKEIANNSSTAAL